MAQDVKASTNAIAELTAQPLATAQQTALQKWLWVDRAAAVPGLEIVVPACPCSADELAAFAMSGRRVGYLPPQVATQTNRHWPGTMFPVMRSYAVAATNRFPNAADAEGWFKSARSHQEEWWDEERIRL
nr:hypothetical protein GCM10020063_001440 [Dactylosporangium thailandense]